MNRVVSRHGYVHQGIDGGQDRFDVTIYECLGANSAVFVETSIAHVAQVPCQCCPDEQEHSALILRQACIFQFFQPRAYKCNVILLRLFLFLPSILALDRIQLGRGSEPLGIGLGLVVRQLGV